MSRRSLIALPVLCAALIAGCGSSAKPTAAAGISFPGAATALKYAQCMRSHGVSNFPDPASGGGGVQIASGSGINPGSPAFAAARSECRKLLPYGGFGARSGHASAAVQKQMLRIAVCMRAHGVPGFPDPTTTRPASMAGLSGAMSDNGVTYAFPDTLDLSAPAAEQAEKTCHIASVAGPGPLP